jgi:3' terminal RNA ribose 2'-O-methyltransferase Hen1
MLLTITTTRSPATDLGYLLHKHPAKCQTFSLAYGSAHVFYPEADDARCTAALLLDVDPIGMVRNRRGPKGDRGTLGQYVNDRPYVASSFLSVAIAQVYGSALGGRCNDRPELVDQPWPLEVQIAVLPCRGGESLLHDLFEPLGYEIGSQRHALDETFPDWGDSPYYTVTLRAERPLRELLAHLYVLIPVLDNEKHYWVGDDEVAKLMHFGEGWLAAHPAKEQITRRYLKHQPSLARQAIARLIAEESPDADSLDEAHDPREEAVEEKISLNEQRLGTVLSVLNSAGAKRVIDLGCGEGKLLRELLKIKAFEEIVGLDVSHRALEKAAARLRLERLPDLQRDRITLLHGSLMYRDRRLEGYDAATVVEVIEHLDPPRLAAFERVLFEFARPKVVIVTTPNSEYNVRFETLPAGKLRHPDHRFEWTREEFQTWASKIAERFGYTVRFLPVGPEDAEVGAPTQMGVFST